MAAETSETLRVAVIGLGTVGRAVAHAVRAAADLQLAGGADINAAIVANPPAALSGVPVTQDVRSMPPADVAIVCGGRRFDRIAPTLRDLMARKIPTISDCPEMVWPWLRHPHLADVIASEARAVGVALLGAGPDPMAMMWAAGTVNGLVVEPLTAIRVERRAHPQSLRVPARRDLGMGRTAEQFRRLATDRLIGFPGQDEWVVLIAQASGRHPMRGEIRTTLRPSTTEDNKVCGVFQKSTWSTEGFDVQIDETVADGLPDDQNTITLSFGSDPLKQITQPFMPSTDDAFKAEALVDIGRKLRTLPLGLLTLLDLL